MTARKRLRLRKELQRKEISKVQQLPTIKKRKRKVVSSSIRILISQHDFVLPQ